MFRIFSRIVHLPFRYSSDRGLNFICLQSRTCGISKQHDGRDNCIAVAWRELEAEKPITNIGGERSGNDPEMTTSLAAHIKIVESSLTVGGDVKSTLAFLSAFGSMNPSVTV